MKNNQVAPVGMKSHSEKRGKGGMKLKKGKRNFLQRLNSITLYVVIVSVVSFTVFLGLSIYFAANTSDLSVKASENERKEAFDTISRYLSNVMSDVQAIARSFLGTVYWQPKLVCENDIDSLLRSFVPSLYEYIPRFNGKTDMTFGMYYYLSNDNGSTYDAHYNIIYKNGDIHIENFTNLNIWELPDYPVDDETEFVLDTLDDIVLYSAGTYAWYPTVHEAYENWVGYSSEQYGYTPFVSYSIGMGELDLSGVSECDGLTLAGNPWAGLPILSFSDYLRSFTSADSITWLLEIKNDFLLASSDVFNITEMVDVPNGYALQSVTKYKKGVVRSVSAAIMKLVPSLLDSERESVLVKLDDRNYQVYWHYLNQTEFGGEWLILNAKTVWNVYKASAIYIIIIAIVLVVFYTGVVVCWLVVGINARRSFVKLIKMMRRVRDMDLDDLVPSKRGYSELVVLEDHFLFLVDQLKNYRAFLPQSLQPSAMDMKSSFRSSPSSHSLELETASDAGSENDGYIKVFGEAGEKLKSPMGSSTTLNSMQLSANSSDASSLSSEASGSKTGMVDHMGEGKFRLGLYKKKICVLLIDFHSYSNVAKIYDIILHGYSSSEYIYEFQPDYVKIILLNNQKVKLLLMRGLHIQSRLVEEGFKTRFFLSSGTGIYGNLGNSKIKRFVCGGPVRDNVFRMRENAPNFVSFVIDYLTQIIVKIDVETRMINEEQLFEVGKPLKVSENDEWMYVMAKKEELQRWEVFNEATRMYMLKEKDSPTVAHRIFKEYREKNPGDELANLWIEKIEKETQMGNGFE